MLRVLRHDARVAHAIELDAATGFLGLGQSLRRVLQRKRAGVVAVLEEGGHGVVDHLDRDVAGLVVHIHAAVDEGHAFAHTARKFQFEVRQAVVAHAAAKAHHGGLAHMRAVGQLGHGQVGKSARIGQHQLAHALLRWGQ